MALPIISPYSDSVISSSDVLSITSSLYSGTTPVVWSLTGSPSGMIIDSSSGTISWASPTAGIYHVQVNANNSDGTGSQIVVIKVTESISDQLFAPRVVSPLGGSQNTTVTIEWEINDPPSPDTTITTDSVFYELEYTDDYDGRETNWYGLDSRIPWSNTSFLWTVGNSIKSNNVRVRMRARSNIDESVSDWSISDSFSVNVYDLIPPAIVNPLPNLLYSDFIVIILDESLVKNTFNQKVRYTIEYSSEKQNINWTTIVSDLAVGQSVIRWNLDGVPTSDDYIIRLTAKNISCLETTESAPDQIARTFVHGVRIQQSGVFIIDTKPPEAVLEIENRISITSQREQVLNIFAEDTTTRVEQIQLRECDITQTLGLGDLATTTGTTGCPPVLSLINGETDFSRIIGKPIGNYTKIQWTLDDVSGLRKIEALLSDSGGNTSLQSATKVFISSFDSETQISDYIIVVEQRDKIVVNESPPSVTIEPAIFEVLYLGNESGEFWVLEPFARLLYTIDGRICKLFDFNGVILVFAYNESLDEGYVYRHDSTVPTLLHTFTASTSITTGVAQFGNSVYIGLSNGQLWKYSGFSFTLLSAPITDTITCLSSDDRYLYVGYKNSSDILLYNGDDFFTSSIA